MAAEMSVPFLGSVPIDVKFGQLVESQEIGGDTDSDYEDEDGNIGETAEQPQEQGLQQRPAEDDNRLLVDRYMDCWSYPVFEGFTKALLEKIET